MGGKLSSSPITILAGAGAGAGAGALWLLSPPLSQADNSMAEAVSNPKTNFVIMIKWSFKWFNGFQKAVSGQRSQKAHIVGETLDIAAQFAFNLHGQTALNTVVPAGAPPAMPTA
jgi:hypothetical protein